MDKSMSLASFSWLVFPACVAALGIPGCATDAVPLGAGSDAEVVECLVPGQIRQLDDKVTFPTQRQLIQTTRKECRNRGGEEKVPEGKRE
jgi:hypothetical protein